MVTYKLKSDDGFKVVYSAAIGDLVVHRSATHGAFVAEMSDVEFHGLNAVKAVIACLDAGVRLAEFTLHGR